jgi:hypothetical protein
VQFGIKAGSSSSSLQGIAGDMAALALVKRQLMFRCVVPEQWCLHAFLGSGSCNCSAS